MRRVIIISGHPGAGKSTAANHLKTKFFGDIINVGDVINDFLVSNGIFIKQREQYGKYFLKYYNESKLFDILSERITDKLTIIDGLRLFSIYKKIQEYDQKTLLFYINTNQEIRNERLRVRLSNLNNETIQKRLEIYNLYSEDITKLEMASNINIKNNTSLTDFYSSLEREFNNISFNE